MEKAVTGGKPPVLIKSFYNMYEKGKMHDFLCVFVNTVAGLQSFV